MSTVDQNVLRAIDPESVRAIAKKDFQDAVRSYLFWGLSAFFLLLLVFVSAVISYFGGDIIAAEGVTTDVLVYYVSQITRLVIPLVALILGWRAIAGERDSGSIKVLLSLPHSRADVVLGKLIGRSAVLSLSLVVGFSLAAVIVAVIVGGFDVGDYAGLLAMSIVYGVAYTSIAVGISALTRSTTLAAMGAFFVFVLFYVIWDVLMGVIGLLVIFEYIPGIEYTTSFNGQEVERVARPAWAFLLETIDPGNAYNNGLSLVTTVPELTGVGIPKGPFGGELPFYLQDWFSFVILLFWIVVPVAVGYLRFSRSDL